MLTWTRRQIIKANPSPRMDQMLNLSSTFAYTADLPKNDPNTPVLCEWQGRPNITFDPGTRVSADRLQ